jgi:hypothetical protein
MKQLFENDENKAKKYTIIRKFITVDNQKAIS